MDYSPYNLSVAGKDDSDGKSDFTTIVTLVKIVTESRNVTMGGPTEHPVLACPIARFEFDKGPGGSASKVCTWTLSETPNSIKGNNTLDITVKQVSLVMNWLHDYAQVGMQIKLKGVSGEMAAVAFDEQTAEPIVPKHILLLSAGIGITPNLAMVRGVCAFGLQNGTIITMIHVERHEEDLMSQSKLKRRAKSYPNLQSTNVITSRGGRLTRDGLGKLMPPEAVGLQEAYICGPAAFMTDMTKNLVTLGIPAANINTKSFEF